MKKSLVICGVAALVLASCTQNEVLEVSESRAIGFDNAFIDNPVRAAIGNVDALKSFYVFGGFDSQYINVYNNTAVTRSGEQSPYTWTPEYPAYWQIGKTYTFDAYAANAKIDDATCDANGVKFPNAVTVDGTNDIIVAAAAEDKTVDEDFLASPEKVEFTFKHTLSQVKFTFKTGIQNVDFTVTNVILKNVATTGTYASSVWKNGEQNGTYDANNVSGKISSTSEQSTSPIIVMPQAMTNTQTVTFNLKAEGGIAFDENIITVKMPNIDLEEGKSYNFIAKLTPENIDPENQYKPIEFEVTAVNGWETASQTPDTETDLTK